MINLFVTQDQTDLWLALGMKFFREAIISTIDLKLGDRRFVSLNNELTVETWSREWTGNSLLQLVGFKPNGSKLKILRESYVDEDKLIELKEAIHEIKHMSFKAVGMNFKMKTSGKGGCLSSFHVIRVKKEWRVFVYAKVVEVPRKFLADLRLISDIIKELDFPKDENIQVTFNISSIYYSIISLRAYVNILKLQEREFCLGEIQKIKGAEEGTPKFKYVKVPLPITERRNYQLSIQEAIEEYSEEHGDLIDVNNLNYKTGEWIW